MLAPCHSYLLTPSVPVGADRLIGSYCSTSESKEGKLWPLPCSLASLFHFKPCFSRTSPDSSLVLAISIFLCALQYFYSAFACPLISCSLPLCASLTSSLSSRCLFLTPLLSLALPCHASVIPTLSLFLSPHCTYPSIPAWSATSNLAGHILLLLHLLAWSPISLYRHCHLFYYIVSSVSCAGLVHLCHHLHLSTNPPAFITFSAQRSQGTNLQWLHGEKHVQSSKACLAVEIQIKTLLSPEICCSGVTLWWLLQHFAIIGVLSKFHCSNGTRYPVSSKYPAHAKGKKERKRRIFQWLRVWFAGIRANNGCLHFFEIADSSNTLKKANSFCFFVLLQEFATIQDPFFK